MPRPSLTFTVDFQPIGRRARSQGSETLLDLARAVGVELQATCGGGGSCGACRVQVMSGALTPVTDAETGEFSATELSAGFRLACQARPRSDVRLHLPPESLCTGQRLQLEAQGMMAVVDRVPNGATLPAGGRPLGLAVDLGTTKIAMYLMDLERGETLASRATTNPQIAFGEDVISRVAYASQAVQQRELLGERVREGLARLAEEVCQQAGVPAAWIVEAVIVGNTAMHHLLVGLPVEQLGLAPYRPAITGPLDLPFETLGLLAAQGARVHLPPLIAGFVGSDHVAMLLGAGLDDSPGTVLAVDIGTNTEMSLWHRERLRTCSCPSGPAFEGAHLSTGMRAAPGAVEAVRIDGSVVRWRTIENRPPVGICGSGILDVVAELFGAGLLTDRGAFRGRHPSLREGPRGPEFVVAPATSTGTGQDLTVERRDVHEIQLAKAAIRSGVETLLADAEIGVDAVEELVLAGAFGSYLDLRSAIRIGMFPALPRERFRQVGNAAGLGARQILASRARREAAGTLAARAQHLELSADPGFRQRYLDALWIPLRPRSRSASGVD